MKDFFVAIFFEVYKGLQPLKANHNSNTAEQDNLIFHPQKQEDYFFGTFLMKYLKKGVNLILQSVAIKAGAAKTIFSGSNFSAIRAVKTPPIDNPITYTFHSKILNLSRTLMIFLANHAN